MSKLISALFPEGHRKVMVNLVVLGVAVAIEKLGGGLSDNLETMLIAIAAIFTGGNVLANLGQVLVGLKGTKVGQIIEDVIPGDQGLGAARAVQARVEAASIPQVRGISPEDVLEESARRADELEKKLAVTNQNIGQIVQILNNMRQAAQPQAAPRPPGA